MDVISVIIPVYEAEQFLDECLNRHCLRRLGIFLVRASKGGSLRHRSVLFLGFLDGLARYVR